MSVTGAVKGMPHHYPGLKDVSSMVSADCPGEGTPVYT